MEDEILVSIDKKLGALVRLFAMGCITGKTKTEAIVTLGGLGLEPNLIADIVDTTPAAVYARLSEAKKKKGNK